MDEVLGTENLTTQVKALVKKIIKDGEDGSMMEDLSNQLLGVVAKFPSFNLDENSHVQTEIETSAVSLWNFAVAKKINSSLPITLNAKLRHIAFKLVYLSNSHSNDEASLRKQIMTTKSLVTHLLCYHKNYSPFILQMALKTARAWLDCDTPSMADNPLTMTAEFLDKLKQIVEKKKQGLDGCGDAEKEALKKKEISLKKDTFKMMCYKAEATFGQGQKEEASNIAYKLKEMLSDLPEEGAYLTMMTFNFGVDEFQRGEYENSVPWLKFSFDTGKSTHTVSGKNQARTLRLLANAYLEWDSKVHSQKALNAVGLANAEHSHPAGQYLKLRILLEGNAETDRVQAGLDDLLRQPELTEDLGIATIKLIAKHNRHDIAFEGMSRLSKRFDASLDIGTIWSTHLELLLSSNERDKASKLAEDYITSHKTNRPMDESTQKQFHQLFWDEAAREYESQDFKGALQWYNYSLSLYPTQEESDSNRAKLHRNRASCYIGLQQLDMAYEAVRAAEKCDSTSAFTFYLIYKITLMQGEDDKALDALRRMCKCGESTSGTCPDGLVGDQGPTLQGLISLAAHLAMEQSNRQVALTALEGLVQMSSNSQQVLTATRCLVRLRLNMMEQDSMEGDQMEHLVSYINLAYDRLIQMSEETSTAVVVEEESTWFMKMAWNLAIQCGDAVNVTSKLFILCLRLNGLCPNANDVTGMMRQKACLIMGAAALLEQVKGMEGQSNKTAVILQQALSHIKECRTVLDMIKQTQIDETGTSNLDSTTPKLLLLYEFEARSKLGDPGLENLLDEAIELPNVDPKTFETIAALSMEAPTQNSRVSIRALKIAIKKHLQSSDIDYEKCSRAFHSLVQLALEKGGSLDSASRDEAWGYYMDVVHVIENAPKDKYPEMEILWLMTKAWNCGIHYYSAGKFEEAQRWCELSMKLLKYLSTLQNNYSQQMTSIYADILAKRDEKKSQSSTMYL